MSLFNQLQTRIANWSQRRHGVDQWPFVIRGRRVYILPTRFGLLYAIAVIGMGLGGMNYANNLALMMAFLLASLGIVAMHHCQRNLVGITLHAMNNVPVFAGQQATLRIRLNHDNAHLRVLLQAEAQWLDQPVESPLVHVPPGDGAVITLLLTSQHRGWLTLPRLVLSTRYPFGLFRAWTVLHLPIQCLIYPKPGDPNTTPPALATDNRANQQRRGDDEFAGFRPWQPGDPPQRIAWKLYAREQGLQVQQHAGAALVTQMFDWQMTQGLPLETRLSRLTRWLMDADAEGASYGLSMPGFHAAPDRGETHLHRCLAALAVHELPPS